jgi:hypothetical protein
VTRRVLCDYLVDEAQHVREEAWLALWVITGKTHGIEKPEVLKRKPEQGSGYSRFDRLVDSLDDRSYQARAELEGLVLDPARLERARDAFLADIDKSSGR